MVATPALQAAFGDALDAADCLENFYEFVRRAWAIADPAHPFIEAWHIRAICDALEAVARGRTFRLVINIPPGHAKSMIVAALWPAWVWTWRPSWQAMFVSYADDLAERDSMRCRNVIKSDWYQRLFVRGAWRLREDMDRKDYFGNTAGGVRKAAGVKGGQTGFRGDAIVVDDAMKATDAYSAAERKFVVRWWDDTIPTRGNDPAATAFVVIAQRLHEDDLPGHLLRQGTWQHLCLPSRFEPKRTCEKGCACGGGPSRVVANDNTEITRDPRTEPDEPLFPQLYTQAVLDGFAKLPSWAGQHQQRPTPEGGGMFRTSAWGWWRPDGVAPDARWVRPRGASDAPAVALPRLDVEIISVDANFKKTKDGSRFCAIAIGLAGERRFVLGVRWCSMDFVQACSALSSLIAAHPGARLRYVEEAANGAAIISEFEAKGITLTPIKPRGSKEARASAIQADQWAGVIYLPEGAPWVADFVDEFSVFPNGSHDDAVDALSQGLAEAADNAGAVAWVRRMAGKG